MTPKTLTRINPVAAAAGLLVMAGALITAIALTQQGGVPWIAFLSGLLFAAILAVVYRLTHSDRVVAELQGDLRRFEEDYPVMLAYVAHDEVIRSHNRAFREWLRMRRELIDEHPLREVLGSTTYQEFKAGFDHAMHGRLVQEKRVHTQDDRKFHLYVQQIPRKNDRGQVIGVYLALLDVSRFGGSSGTRTLPAQPALANAGRPAPAPVARAPAAANTPDFAEKTMIVARPAPAASATKAPTPAPAAVPARAPAPPPARQRAKAVAPTAAPRPAAVPVAAPQPARAAVVPQVTAAKPDLEIVPAAAVMDLEVQTAPIVPDLLTPAPARAPTPMGTAGGERQTFVRTMTEELTKWNNAGDRLRAALENDEFCLYAQEIKPVSAAKGQTMLFELLLRLQEEEEGLMPPGAFIPIAEECGMLPDLDRWVVGHILGWVSRHPARRSVIYSVNVSAPTFATPGFPEFVATELRRHKLPGSLLCFEIAESDAVANVPAAAQFVEKLSALGCHTAICGFGQAAGSYTLIKQMQVDYIKIDGSIVMGATRNTVDLTKLKAIARVASATNRNTVAEFVESDETLAVLRSIGVDLAQGFGIAKPVPLSQLP